MKLPNWPMPRLMSNHGNFIGSLGAVTRWLAAHAEALGVEIYPGFAAAEVLYGENGEVVGVATGDMGIGRDGEPKANFTRGMELRGKYTLLGEGARGSLGKQIIARYRLDAGREPQKYGIGLKELWQVQPSKFREGLVQHSFGWPLGGGTSGGSFLYHYDENLVSVGFVVHLNYQNPTCRRSTSSSASRRIPRSATLSRAASGSPMARGQFPRAAGSRSEARLPRRRADRLRGGLRQFRPHQGLAQRDPVRDAGGGERA